MRTECKLRKEEKRQYGKLEVRKGTSKCARSCYLLAPDKSLIFSNLASNSVMFKWLVYSFVTLWLVSPITIQPVAFSQFYKRSSLYLGLMECYLFHNADVRRPSSRARSNCSTYCAIVELIQGFGAGCLAREET